MLPSRVEPIAAMLAAQTVGHLSKATMETYHQVTALSKFLTLPLLARYFHARLTLDSLDMQGNKS